MTARHMIATEPPTTCLSYCLDFYLGHIKLPDDNFKDLLKVQSRYPLHHKCMYPQMGDPGASKAGVFGQSGAELRGLKLIGRISDHK